MAPLSSSLLSSHLFILLMVMGQTCECGRYVFTIKDRHASQCEPKYMSWRWGPGTLDAERVGNVSRCAPSHLKIESTQRAEDSGVPLLRGVAMLEMKVSS